MTALFDGEVRHVDLNRSKWNPAMCMEKTIMPGATIGQYGLFVQRVNNSGAEAVQAVAGTSATEAFIGIAIPDSRPITNRQVVETATVPSAAPRTVTLSNSNVISGQLSVYDSSGTLLTITTHYTVSSNVVTFVDATYADTTCTFIYRHTLTSEEIQELYGSAWSNMTASALHMQTPVITGDVEIFTDLVDANKQYALTSSLYTYTGGLVSSADLGTATNLTTGFGAKVIEVPTVNSPLVGIRYHT